VIGALSGRMSGADKLNPQGIKSTKEVRECFPLAWEEMRLIGGDMESFEVVIAVASYGDKKLEKALLTLNICAECKGTGTKSCKSCSKLPFPVVDCVNCTKLGCTECQGKGESKQKIHGLFGMVLYEKSYKEVVLSKATDFDMYKNGKQGVFSQMYGGTEHTLMDRLGLSEEAAFRGADRWRKEYPGVANAQKRIVNSLQSMQQAGGLGTKITWAEPADYVQSLLGFKRYFTLENTICKVLFDIAEKPPTAWTNYKIKVVRRDREQTIGGAVRSAVFAAAFNIQSSNTRAGINHEIQATGAEITKRCQCDLWALQPSGIHPWVIMPMNIHDEIMAPTVPEMVEKAEQTIRSSVERFKPVIPLIAIDWANDLKTWADK
jgi:hypothetical protein